MQTKMKEDENEKRPKFRFLFPVAMPNGKRNWACATHHQIRFYQEKRDSHFLFFLVTSLKKQKLARRSVNIALNRIPLDEERPKRPRRKTARRL